MRQAYGFGGRIRCIDQSASLQAPLTHEEAVRIIIKDKGTHFDPDIVDAFLTVSEEFRNIAREYADSEKQEVLKPDDRAAS